jgi:hypothetical protein
MSHASALASIAAMFARKLIVISVLVAASAGLAACGDEQPDPSIPLENAQTLLGTLEEIRSNVDVGSCELAADKVDELNSEIESLPSDVPSDLRTELEDGANQLSILVGDPDQCDQPEEPTTTEETTTDETTTEATEPTTTTQPTETTPTVPTTPTNPGGGVGPGSDGL